MHRTSTPIEKAIQSAGFTLKEVADKIGITYITLHKSIQGIRPFNCTEAIKISNLLGLTTEQTVDIFFKKN